MHNVNVEQTQEVVVQPSPGNSHQWLRPDRETRKRHHHEVSSWEDSDDSDVNDMLTHKSPRVNSLCSCVQS